MPSEIDAELRNTLRSLQTGLESVGRAQKRTTDEVKRFADEAKKAFGGGRRPVEDLDKLAKKHAQSWRDVGTAIGRMGGPIGDVVGRLTGLQSANTTMARLGLYSAAAGIAVGLVVRGLERAGLQARESAAAWRTMTEAMLAAKSASLAVGTSGMSQADGRRALVTAGPEAVRHAQALANTGVSDPADVEKGVATIYSKYGKGARARETASTAHMLASTGAFTYSEAADALIDYGADVSSGDAHMAYKVAGRLFMNKTGRRGMDPSDALTEAIANQPNVNYGPSYEGGVRKTRRVENQTRGVERDAVENGAAEAAARGKLAAERDPVSAAVLQVANQQALTVQELQKIAAGSNSMLEWLKHYTTGSNRDAAERAQQAGAAGAAVYTAAAPAG